MKRLQTNRIEELTRYLKEAKVDPSLFPEILDHMACEAEEQLWDGKSFAQAYAGIVGEADAQTLLYLSAETKQLLAMDKSLNDIVFENRNKDYGAYELRKGYNKTVQWSFVLGVTLFACMIQLPNLYARLVPEKKADAIAYEVEIKNVVIKPDKPKEDLPKERAQVKNTVQALVPEVKQDHLVNEELLPPTVDAFEDANPGPETIAGEEGIEVAAPVGTGGITLVEPTPTVEPKAEETVTFAEQSPEYRGGQAKMAEFLQKNLKYPSAASAAGIQGRVFVQFTVGSDGHITDVKPIKGIGFGCDEEAVRVVKMMPEWVPGRQSGRAVKVKYTLPIVFQLN